MLLVSQLADFFVLSHTRAYRLTRREDFPVVKLGRYAAWYWAHIHLTKLTTLVLQNGADLKAVSGMLGHYRARFTLDTYPHVTTAAQWEAVNTTGNLFSDAV